MATTTEQLRQLVAGHPAAPGRELESQARMLRELERLDDPCREQADLTHFTASAIVVGPRGTVLHLHKRLGRWLQPGGHIEAGETPPEGARREAMEELGLDATHPDDGPHLIHLDVHEAALGHVHLDLRYLLLAPDEDPAPTPGESPEARWYSWDEATAAADEALIGALSIARAQWEALSVGDTV
jgi:8-oxo-dGTP pyrophosphatase MutT (NUDIX family)